MASLLDEFDADILFYLSWPLMTGYAPTLLWRHKA